MARSHARWKVEAWETGSEFRTLTMPAQWLYIALVSQPQINNCGVLPYVPDRWKALAAGTTKRVVMRALRELTDTNFVTFDARTGEILVRSFIKHDNVRKQPNLVTSAKRQFREVESATIRRVLAANYPDLFEYTAQPCEPTTEPLSKGVPEGVQGRGSPNPFTEGVPEGVNARTRAAPAPSPSIPRAVEERTYDDEPDTGEQLNGNSPGINEIPTPDLRTMP